MRNSNGGNVCPKCNSANTTNDARQASKISKILTSTEVELLDFFHYLDRPDIIKSLKLVHSMALYHSTLPVDDSEKTALYDVKVLSDLLEKMDKET